MKTWVSPPRVRWGRALLLLGALAGGCLVGNVDVNPALDEQAGSSANAGSAGESANGGKPPAEGGSSNAGDDGQAGSPTSAAGDRSQGGSSGTSPAGGAGAGPGGEGGGPPVFGCTYDEQRDASNQHAEPVVSGSAEATGQSTGGFVDICGQIDADHFVTGGQLVDIDSFIVDVANAGEIFTSIEFGQDVDTDSVELVITPADGSAEQRVRASPTDGAWWSVLPQGATTVSLVVRDGSALSGPIPYVIRMKPDDIDARCPRVTAVEAYDTYAEANDGANNQGNDVVRMSTTVGLNHATASGQAIEDTPTIRNGENFLFSGSAGPSSATGGYGYGDGDAYSMFPAATKQISLRLYWPGSDADLDLWVLQADSFNVVARATHQSKAAPELLTFAVNSNTDYWLWVGARTGATLPKSYDLTVCGSGIGQ